MNNINTKEYIEGFLDDLVLAYLYPEQKSTNCLVHLFLEEYPQDPAIETTRTYTRILYRKTDSRALANIILETENPEDYLTKFFDDDIWGRDAWPIKDEDIRCMVKSIGSDRAKELCRYIIQFICAYHEFLRRNNYELDGLDIRKKPKGYNMDSIQSALFQILRIKSPILEDTFSEIKKGLGINIERESGGVDGDIYAELENDNALVSKRIRAKDEADCIRVGEIYYEILIGDCDKEFANFSDVEIIESVGKKDNDWRYLPNRVWEKAVDELTDYPRVRKLKERLTKRGKNEEEIKGIIKEQSPDFFNFKKPNYIVCGKVKNKKGVISEEYLPPKDNQEKVVSYVQTKAMAIKTLEELKKTGFRNSPAGRALIDYHLDNIDNEEAKFTNREIALATGYNEDVIGKARKRLKKELLIIREPSNKMTHF